MLQGVLIIDKPGGMTSHDVVNRIRPMAGLRRVGHCGTLDPMATGVLVLCLGSATKIVQFLQAEEKEYLAEMTLGQVSDTQDSTGEILQEKSVPEFSQEQLQKVFQGHKIKKTFCEVVA